jgi:hypothetical protein
MNPYLTASAIGINIGAYADPENPWIWFSGFLFLLIGLFYYAWRERKREVIELRRKLGYV